MMRRVMRFLVVLIVAVLAVLGAAVAVAPQAQAANTPQTLHFEYGPIHINTGQNIIQFSAGQVPKPTVDGWIVGIKPNLLLPDNSTPAVDIIHLHHAVWINLSRTDSTAGLPQRFFAAGEEKTALTLPGGYGYRYKASDNWLLDFMIHDLVATPFDVRISYDLSFIPDSSVTKPMTEVLPIWMDVQNGGNYPVFDVHRGSGTNGQYTYPDQAANPYGTGPAKNQHTMPTGGTLVAAAGHLHPGGLWNDLYVDRGGQSAHVFRSNAKYFEKAGPVSWDVTMGITKANWKVHVNAGDTLRTTVTYDSSARSWYETMGIMVLWFVPNMTTGLDPFAMTPADMAVRYTHGHLPENNNHGGKADPDLPNPTTLADGPPVTDIAITNYEFTPGDLDLATQVPTVLQGHSIRFTNNDAPSSGYGIWHSITACALPCNLTTGIAYPTANALIEFDSGQLGNFGVPTAGRLTWDTPTNLAPGTYSFWCRVHPFMRGAFRVLASP